jgi:predicted ATP-dependent serine protease
VSERCIRCGGPHKQQRCPDCHAWGQVVGSWQRKNWRYHWIHDPTCSRYQPRYYSEAEQERHQKAAGSKNSYDTVCGTTGEFALECAHCWAAADYDHGESEAL